MSKYFLKPCPGGSPRKGPKFQFSHKATCQSLSKPLRGFRFRSTSLMLQPCKFCPQESQDSTNKINSLQTLNGWLQSIKQPIKWHHGDSYLFPPTDFHYKFATFMSRNYFYCYVPRHKAHLKMETSGWVAGCSTYPCGFLVSGTQSGNQPCKFWKPRESTTSKDMFWSCWAVGFCSGSWAISKDRGGCCP